MDHYNTRTQNQRANSQQPIRQPMPDLVSILILAHNKAEYTQRCLNSLFESSLRPFQVVLVNNGSNDHTQEVLEAFKKQGQSEKVEATLLDLGENRGAIVGRNQGMACMKGDYWIFLDNDVTVRTRSWLESMRSALQKDPQLAMVAPKLVYPSPPHNIQCAGCQVTQGGQVIFRGRGSPIDTPEWNQPHDCQTLISACWMIRAAAAKKVGLLDEQFSPVQFEDIDYCYRIREEGGLCRYLPAIEMYHFENVTSGRTKALNYPYLTVKNGLKFKKKWKHRFSKEDGPEDKDWKWAQITPVSLDEIPEKLELKP